MAEALHIVKVQQLTTTKKQLDPTTKEVEAKADKE